MKNINDDVIRIERFSKNRYEAYKKKGTPFHVVCGNGRLCEVKAFDCGKNKDQVFVEYFYKYCGRDHIGGYYANQKTGCTEDKDQDSKLFIYLGPWFKKGDLVVRTTDGTKGRTIFFWHGIMPKENMRLEGLAMYSQHDDMHGSQFSRHTTGYPMKRDGRDSELLIQRFRLATDKDVTDYRKELREHRFTWEDDGRIYHYPHVGDHYFEIFFNHGVADFRERVMDSEDNRPEISRLIMECDMTFDSEFRERHVRERVEKINKALGLASE